MFLMAYFRLFLYYMIPKRIHIGAELLVFNNRKSVTYII